MNTSKFRNVGPSVIIWAGLYYGGKSEPVVLDDIMNQRVYKRVLQQSLPPGQETSSRTTLPWSEIMLRPTQPS